MAEWAEHLELARVVNEIAAELQRQKSRVVLAESCTGGLAGAALATVPGISDYFCGSAVTYRECTKIEWLGVSAATLAEFTAESLDTTRELALNVLQRTPEADWSAAITGHLGPNAPTDLDGQIFVSIARRNGQQAIQVADGSYRLRSQSRPARQVEASQLMLTELLRCLRLG